MSSDFRNDWGRRRRHPWRAGVLVAAVGVVLLTAACGGGTSSGASGSLATGGSSAAGGSPTTAGSTTYAQEVAFAECMRSHGVPNFPDPTSHESFIIGNAGHGTYTPAMQAAQKACAGLLPNGGQPTQAQQHQNLMRELKYSDCMRSHGVANFADPNPAGSPPAGGSNMSAGSNLTQSPQFQKAQKACQPLLFGTAG